MFFCHSCLAWFVLGPIRTWRLRSGGIEKLNKLLKRISLRTQSNCRTWRKSHGTSQNAQVSLLIWNVCRYANIMNSIQVQKYSIIKNTGVEVECRFCLKWWYICSKWPGLHLQQLIGWVMKEEKNLFISHRLFYDSLAVVKRMLLMLWFY